MFRYLCAFFLLFFTPVFSAEDDVAVSDKDQPKMVESPDETYLTPQKKEPGDTVKKKKKQINNSDDWGPNYPDRTRSLNQVDRYVEPGEKAADNDPNNPNRMGPGTNLNELDTDRDIDHDASHGEKPTEELGGPGTDLNKEAHEDAIKEYEGPQEDLNKMRTFEDGNPQDTDLSKKAPKPSLPSKKKPKPSTSREGITKTKVEGVDRYGSGVLIPETKGLVLFDDREDFSLVDRSSLVGFHTVNLDVPGDPQELEKRVNRLYLGKPLTKEVIQELIDTIEAYFAQYNRPLTKVIVPRQGLRDGVLALLVIQAQLGQVKSEGNVWLKSERLQEYVKLQPGEVIDERTLRENLNFINRNPFRTVEAVYAEGQNYKTTDIELVVKERSPFRLYTGADSLGLSAINRTRFFVGFNYGNLFGADQIFSYQFTFSKSFKSYQAHTASYQIPLPWQHVLEFFGGYSQVRVKMQKPFNRNTGTSWQASSRYTIPLPNLIPEWIHEVRFGADFKQLNNSFEFIEDFPRFGKTVTIFQVMGGYQGEYSDRWFKTGVEFDGYFSPGKWLGNQEDSDYQSLRDNSKAYYAYARGELKQSFLLFRDSAIEFKGAGQWASIPLIPSEQFGVGGMETVRGYEERTLNGDQGVLASLELLAPSFDGFIRPRISKKGILTQDKWQFLLFCDYGKTFLKANQLNTKSNGQTANEPKVQYLLGVGPGVRYQVGHYFYGRLDLGYKVKKDRASYGGGNFMVHFSAIASF